MSSLLYCTAESSALGDHIDIFHDKVIMIYSMLFAMYSFLHLIGGFKDSIWKRKSHLHVITKPCSLAKKENLRRLKTISQAGLAPGDFI